MKAWRFLLCSLLLSLFMTSAHAGSPKTFQKVENPQWVMFEVRNGMDFDRAWNAVFDILIKDFDLEMVQKDDGYIRTSWLHSYGGTYKEEYRVRVTIRFTPDRKALRIKTEANVKDGVNWIIGVDSSLLATMKTDLMGTIGRTTR